MIKETTNAMQKEVGHGDITMWLENGGEHLKTFEGLSKLPKISSVVRTRED